MNIVKFPNPFTVPEAYLREFASLFSRHGYDLSTMRSEDEVAAALGHIAQTEWAAVASRMEAAALDSSLPSGVREFWAQMARDQSV